MSDESTAGERRDAEALARALDAAHEPSEERVPDEVLEAALLVRLGAAGGWDEVHGEELGQRLMHEAGAKLSARRERWRERGRRRRLGALLVACLAGALLAVVRPWHAGGPELAAASLPPPAPALLVSQLAVAGGDAEARGQLRDEMRSYRTSLYAHIRTHYEETR